ncbi:MAG: preprotein translocase subunit SecY [Lactobacillus sp.]|jgi:preprotein translocase subunit SecY|nr:preprotein translocase subunit SecY [Lactobacillus sp.]MCI1917224.1 preprotein translocase subunit SecY [Lactobacillus sp.]MCI1973121.1 preprotein translocase subunit SecY [Lactobacillus sp.]MCI2016660.1 preprotein translocase subunit SecY [Lactobacillus sp.]MCI2037464.1 preprotein translocase subunit SecY [Lactobacillus sp.]
MKTNHDLLKRCLTTMMLVAILALGQQIPIPGYDLTAASDALAKFQFLKVFSYATGGALGAPTLMSLGLGPYMTALILWQALSSLGIPAVDKLSMRTDGFIQNGITAVLALVQGFEMLWLSRSALTPLYLPGGSYDFSFLVALLILTAGAMLVVYLALYNADHGIGSTVMLILPGLILNIPNMLQNGWGHSPYPLTPEHIATACVVGVIVLLVAVPLNYGEIRFELQKPMLESAFSKPYLPLPFLTAGSMPFMFSTMVFTIPQTVVQATNLRFSKIGQGILAWTDYLNWRGIITYGVILVLLGFVFGFVNFQPSKQAKTLKESGDYIAGVMPGDDTEAFLTHHFLWLTVIGNSIIFVIALIPLVIGLYVKGVSNYTLLIGNLFIMITIISTVVQQFQALRLKNQYQLFDE